MQFVGKVFTSMSEFYKDINPSTLSGAIDVVVVDHRRRSFADGDGLFGATREAQQLEDEEPEMVCSPFHVRFGKLQLLRPQEKAVEVRINGQLREELKMKVGEAGEAFFVLPVDSSSAAAISDDLLTSPLAAPLPRDDEVSVEPLALSQLEVSASSSSRAVPAAGSATAKLDGEAEYDEHMMDGSNRDDLARPGDGVDRREAVGGMMNAVSDSELETGDYRRRFRLARVSLDHSDPTSAGVVGSGKDQESTSVDVVALGKDQESAGSAGIVPSESAGGGGEESDDGALFGKMYRNRGDASVVLTFDGTLMSMERFQKEMTIVLSSLDKLVVTLNGRDFLGTVAIPHLISQSLFGSATQRDDGSVSKLDISESDLPKSVISKEHAESETQKDERGSTSVKPTSSWKWWSSTASKSSPSQQQQLSPGLAAVASAANIVSSSASVSSASGASASGATNPLAAKLTPTAAVVTRATVNMSSSSSLQLPKGAVASPSLDASDGRISPISTSSAAFSGVSAASKVPSTTTATTATLTATIATTTATTATTTTTAATTTTTSANKTDRRGSGASFSSNTSSNSSSGASSTGENVKYFKSLRLPSDMLVKLGLKSGSNSISFTVSTRLQGVATCHANIFLWPSDAQVVISDVDGTITKSDALGHLMTMVGRDWTHPDIARLYTRIAANGYRVLYLTSRSLGQAASTRGYIKGVAQDAYSLPDGPVIMSPDRLMAALRREVVVGNPQEFKIACLKDLQQLFTLESSSSSMSCGEISTTTAAASALGMRRNPFFAGFGNRQNDAMAYLAVGISQSRVFIINPSGLVSVAPMGHQYRGSYGRLLELVDVIFPPVVDSYSNGGLMGMDSSLRVDSSDDYGDFYYWNRSAAVAGSSMKKSSMEGGGGGGDELIGSSMGSEAVSISKSSVALSKSSNTTAAMSTSLPSARSNGIAVDAADRLDDGASVATRLRPHHSSDSLNVYDSSLLLLSDSTFGRESKHDALQRISASDESLSSSSIVDESISSSATSVDADKQSEEQSLSLATAHEEEEEAVPMTAAFFTE